LTVSTSNPSPACFGGARIGDNRGSSSLLVFNAINGNLLAACQLAHHDVHAWDIAASCSAHVAQWATAIVASEDGLLRKRHPIE
jgi:hypothetical protein